MEESALIIRGDVGIVLYDALGEVKDERSIHNLVTTAGRGFIIDRMLGTSAGVMSHMEVGTGTTNPAAGDTALESAVSGSRTALASSTDNGTSVTYVSYERSNVTWSEIASRMQGNCHLLQSTLQDW